MEPGVWFHRVIQIQRPRNEQGCDSSNTQQDRDDRGSVCVNNRTSNGTAAYLTDNPADGTIKVVTIAIAMAKTIIPNTSSISVKPD